MSNSKFYILASFILLFCYSCADEDKVSCNDGILNGTEIDVDCGGDCDPCAIELETPQLTGVWRQYFHEEDGNDLREFYNVNDVFYQFSENGEFNGITVQDDGDIKTILEGIYTFNEVSNLLTIDNGWVNQYNLSYEDADLVLEKDLKGLLDIQKFSPVDMDLCSGINCPVGECHFGYCVE